MRVKRFAAVALAGVMGMSMLAGCGDSGNFNSKQSINLQNAEDNERRYHCSESQQFALR